MGTEVGGGQAAAAGLELELQQMLALCLLIPNCKTRDFFPLVIWGEKIF